jgi:hypothetical protein
VTDIDKYLNCSQLAIGCSKSDLCNDNFTFIKKKQIVMPKFLIERSIPGIQKMTARDLQAISIKSRNVLEELGPQIQWLQSYVMEDRLYCVYVAPDQELIKKHAENGNFPVTHIHEVSAMLDATSADGFIFKQQV